MKEIMLKDIFKGIDPKDYKVHFARTSESNDKPLDAYVKRFDDWKGWNSYSTKDNYNRIYFFSLISFYPEPDTWLFGGIWEVISRDMSKVPYPYEIKLVDDFCEYIGRLKIQYEYKIRPARVDLEDHFPKMIVKEILPSPYSG